MKKKHKLNKYLNRFSLLFILFASSFSIAGGISSGTLLNETLSSNQLITTHAGSNFSLIKSAGVSNLEPALNSSSCELAKNSEPNSIMLFFNNTSNESFNQKFSFTKTLQNIIDSRPQVQSSESSSLQKNTLVQSMLDSFGVTSKVHPESNVLVTLDDRFTEKSLDASILIESDIQPTAIFNRLDQADSKGSHCGEQRIVYHRNSAGRGGRFFIIFEAVIPNPTPNMGLLGCLPIANFWANLTTKSEEQQIEELEKFFYNGVNVSGVRIEPVITFANYQTGQVRTNQFIDFKWQLREFKTDLLNDQAIFETVTVKNNPLAELYSGNNLINDPNFSQLSDEFSDTFNTVYLQRLLAPELQGVSDPSAIINQINIKNDNKFNEFQSDSGFSDNPTALASAQFTSSLQQSLDQMNINGISVDMILNRASSQTCGGCHQSISGREIAPGVFWPNSAGFVHVREDGSFSAALNQHFLPERYRVLTQFICSVPEHPPTKVDGKVKRIIQQNGEYFIKGFACQTGVKEPIMVQVYVGAPAGKPGAKLLKSWQSNLPSGSPAAKVCQNNSNNHRFKIPLSKHEVMTHAGKRIYIHGISNRGTRNLLIDQSGKFTVPNESSKVAGKVKRIIQQKGEYFIKGFACQTGVKDPIMVQVYVGAPAGKPGAKLLKSWQSNLPSGSPAAKVCQSNSNNHRFKIPLSKRETMTHAGKRIYIHGISNRGTRNLLIDQSGVFQVPTVSR